jgi:hypothetical protein
MAEEADAYGLPGRKLVLAMTGLMLVMFRKQVMSGTQHARAGGTSRRTVTSLTQRAALSTHGAP